MSDNEGEDAVEADESVEDIPIDDESDAEPADPEAGTKPDEPADDDLTEHIAETPNEDIAREIGALRERAEAAEQDVEEYSEEVGELESQLKRKQADFQNYKKRAERRREELEERATEDLVERLLDVRDNLERALTQDEDTDIRPGIESTLEEFDRVLADENVATIEPEPGSDVDPQRHEVMLRVESDQPADTIEEVYRPGYEMGEKVLRPAQVTVSE
jgi:molecular chaperone GrpE